MAPSGTMKLLIGGGLPSGEVWQCGLWFESAGPDSVPVTNADADSALTVMTTGTTQFGTFITELRNGLDTGSSVNRYALYSYPTGGSSAAAVAIHDISALVGTGAGHLPNQISRVITLQTSLAGRAHRGRIYLPATGEAMSGATGHFSRDASTLLNDLTAAIRQWTLNPVLQPGGSGVISIVSSSKTGAKTSVRTVRTDNLPDTQRRRANKETSVTFQSSVV